MKTTYKSKENIILYLVILISAIGLIGWKTGELLFASISVLYIPIAPSTAYSFIISSLALILILRVKNNTYIKYLSQGLITLVILTSSMILVRFFVGYGWDLENIFIKNPKQFENMPIGRMSPLTAGLFLINGFTILILPYANDTKKMQRKLNGILALLGFAISAILLIGYLYKAPLLYGGNIIPVAFPTAICFFLLSVVLLWVIKFNLLFFSPLASSSVRILLKSFIPFVLALIVIIGYFNSVIYLRFNNPALFSALLIIIAIPATILLINSIAKSLGTKIENAENAKLESERKFQVIFEQSPIVIEIFDKDGKLRDVNQQTLDMFGIDDIKYVIGFNLWEDPNMSPEKIKILKNGNPIFISTDFDFEIVKKNNLYPTSRSGKIYIDMYAIPLVDKEEITGCLVQIIEVTERKQAEEELNIHRDHLEKLVEERTENLEVKNKELLTKNRELEKYSQLFVDREFRIKELKDEIKELRNR